MFSAPAIRDNVNNNDEHAFFRSFRRRGEAVHSDVGDGGATEIFPVVTVYEERARFSRPKNKRKFRGRVFYLWSNVYVRVSRVPRSNLFLSEAPTTFFVLFHHSRIATTIIIVIIVIIIM